MDGGLVPPYTVCLLGAWLCPNASILFNIGSIMAKPKCSSKTTCNKCEHSPSASTILDLLFLILVLFSGAFLLSSYFSYIFNILSIPLSYFQSHYTFTIPPTSTLLAFFLFFAASFLCCGPRSRRCHAPGCKGLNNATEFDLKLQTEDNLRSGSEEIDVDIDSVPWKGGREDNPDYEYLTSELRKMAPINGRAVLLFRARCGCPIAKLVGWGPKKGKRHKKSLQNKTLTGKGGHR